MSIIQSGRRRKGEILGVRAKNPGVDEALVVSAGFSGDLYLAGTTVRSSTGSPIASTGTIRVSDIGLIEIGDVLVKNTGTTPTATVTDIRIVAAGSKFTYEIDVSVSGSFSFASGDRLVNTSRRPTAYSDSGDDISLGSSTVTAGSDGILRFYTKAKRVDVKVSGGSPAVTTSIVPDVETGETGVTVNILDYGGSIKDAVAALRDMTEARGGIVYCPAGQYIYEAADLEITIDFPVIVRGDGFNATTFYVNTTAGNKEIDFFRLENNYAAIEDLTLKGTGDGGGGGPGAGRGIVISDSGGPTRGFGAVRRCQIYGFASYGIDIGGVSSGQGPFDIARIEHCEIAGSQSGAQLRVGLASTMILVENCRLKAISPSGPESPTGVVCVELDSGANVHLLNCDASPIDHSTNIVATVFSSGSYTNPKDGPAHVVIENCDFEHGSAPGSETVPAIYVQGASRVEVRNTIVYQMGSGVHFEDCFAPVTDGVILKALGGSGYHIKITDTINFQDRNSVYEEEDAAPDNGKRRRPTITTAGNNPGWHILGVTLPRYASDSERDTAPGAGADDKRAAVLTGAAIFVDSPGTPASKVQVYDGSAWVGMAKWTGAAAAAV